MGTVTIVNNRENINKIIELLKNINMINDSMIIKELDIKIDIANVDLNISVNFTPVGV